jgi:hypothetical protein
MVNWTTNVMNEANAQVIVSTQNTEGGGHEHVQTPPASVHQKTQLIEYSYFTLLLNQSDRTDETCFKITFIACCVK